MKILNPNTITNKEVTKTLKDETLSKSKKMVLLFSSGMSIKEIATLMEVRYNFVYNVVSNHVNVNSIELDVVEKDSKKLNIITMYKEGKTNKEISIELKTNYNYVYNTIKKYKLENEVQVEAK